MTLGVFLKLVEIQTKLASLFPFLIGVLFSLNYFGTVNWLNTLIFFVGMLVFDMTTTAINNFMDYKKAKDEMYKREVNIVGQANLKEKQVSRLIILMLIISAVVGMILTYRTGWLLLIMGGICCFIGVFYTYGPVPLSRMPLGELFSGVTMGFGIFMMTVYINAYQLNFFFLQIENWAFVMRGDLKVLLILLIASLPMVFTIANIMLANNLCDMEEDVKNHRYTLPYYIGREVGIKLFNILMYACYIVVIFGVVVGIYKWPVLLVLLTLPLTKKNLESFNKEQVKQKTFIISIKNLVIFNVTLIVGLMMSLFLK
ncbi:1,4-dihydroxy-2-naphthoate polyprenyltransferase [Vagococcus intermedius]|uniref:1,4-dihydroxy-2-naphthoate polyprenyltransferase n=1 Tax=Vagococcus intermedius TaxID=2991418 RepID=A0AAF0CUR1_9ENTE|nr:1,4-dihydroxy-2-naphthoate polyprenyltransferase [Vagococcus intermedius]WEG73353.1 1,4-dihydroxy-2-naphthoate polyprenyltransferase [Vagococcus intermedius]WEG75433.1 1,4-dihydroxy-2-naphthoate polyprenyltransferase [Vagococcus intermedius]